MKKKQLHLTRQDKRQVSIKDQRPKIKVSLVSIDITRRLVSINQPTQICELEYCLPLKNKKKTKKTKKNKISKRSVERVFYG